MDDDLLRLVDHFPIAGHKNMIPYTLKHLSIVSADYMLEESLVQFARALTSIRPADSQLESLDLSQVFHISRRVLDALYSEPVY